MNAFTLLLAALAVLPSDRMQMADRLFNRGKYAQARTEYEALVGERNVPADELLYRLAECDRATGANAAARERYASIAMKYPESRFAAQARFMCAMSTEGTERHKQLAALDSDRVPLSTRTAALYHLGAETRNPDALAKCAALDPKGRYAPFANLRRGSILTDSAIAAERRKGVELLLGIAFSKGELADEALYLAAIQTYRDKHYGEAGSLFRRYRKNHPKGSHFAEALTMSVWSDFMEGRYSDAEAACGEAKSDDLAYVRAACAYALGDNEKALPRLRKYLDDYPKGRYRADAELAVARIEFDAALAKDDQSKTLESARRGFGLSKLAADELRLAWAYEKANKADDAAAEYARVAKNFPGTEEAAEALFRKALVDVRAERWSAVELGIAEALATGKALKFKAEALYWRGVAAMKVSHEEEGAGFLRDAIAFGLSLDKSREARLMVADFDLRNGRTAVAKKAYEKLVSEGACDRMSAARVLAVGKLLGGEEARVCARHLTKSSSPEWRQAGWCLLGTVEETRKAYSAAIESYRKCLAEPVKTAEAADAALRLGRLEMLAGEHERADVTLKTAVSLNGENARARAEAYLALAQNAEARKDFKTACAYATVVGSLFDDEAMVAQAKKIIEAHPEDAE